MKVYFTAILCCAGVVSLFITPAKQLPGHSVTAAESKNLVGGAHVLHKVKSINCSEFDCGGAPGYSLDPSKDTNGVIVQQPAICSGTCYILKMDFTKCQGL